MFLIKLLQVTVITAEGGKSGGFGSRRPHQLTVLSARFSQGSVTESICKVPVREEHRLRVFENRVLRRIFGPKRDEVTGEWR
jgi:hypothetical protein